MNNTTPSALVAHLNQLQHAPDLPDVGRRAAELEAIVNFISPWDLLRLRDLVAKAPVRLASLPDLPIEILCHVATYLDIEDIASCRQLSRACHDVWASQDFSRRLLGRLFPGLLGTAEAQGSASNPSDLLSWAIRRKMNRMRGQYASMTCYKLDDWHTEQGGQFTPDPLSHPDGEYPHNHTKPGIPDFSTPFGRASQPPVFYSHGRVAWKVDRCCFCLDDLRTRYRRLITHPESKLDGICVEILALTEKLLVLCCLERRTVFVYHIDSRAFRHIHLPSNVESAYAHALSIGFVLDHGCYTWSWNERLEQIQIEPHIVDNGRFQVEDMHRGFIFHPWESKYCYLVSVGSTEAFKAGSNEGHSDGAWKRKLVIVVDKYTRGQQTHLRRWTRTREVPGVQFTIDRHVFCQRRDSHGGYTVACVDFRYGKDIMSNNEWVETSFNTETEEMTGPVPLNQRPVTDSISLGRRRVRWNGVDHAFVPESYGSQTYEIWGMSLLTFPVLDPEGFNKQHPTTDYTSLTPFTSDTFENSAIMTDDDFIVMSYNTGYIVWSCQK